MQQATNAGITPTRTGSLSTSNRYNTKNNGQMVYLFLKSGAGEATVTVETAKTVGGLAVADRTFAVAASTGDVVAGPFAPDLFNDGNGDIWFSSSNITGLTVAAIQLG